MPIKDSIFSYYLSLSLSHQDFCKSSLDSAFLSPCVTQLNGSSMALLCHENCQKRGIPGTLFFLAFNFEFLTRTLPKEYEANSNRVTSRKGELSWTKGDVIYVKIKPNQSERYVGKNNNRGQIEHFLRSGVTKIFRKTSRAIFSKGH